MNARPALSPADAAASAVVRRFCEEWLAAKHRALDMAASLELAVFRDGASVASARRAADTYAAELLYREADALLAAADGEGAAGALHDVARDAGGAR